MVLKVKHIGHSVLVSVAQIGFCKTSYQGILILLTIFVLAPWSAFGALTGALTSVLWGHRFGQSVEDQGSGIGGVDCIIVGLMWGGVLSHGGSTVILLPLALLACLSLQVPLQRFMFKWALPPLAVSGLITSWMSYGVFAIFGVNFFTQSSLLPFGVWSVFTALALTFVSCALRSMQGAIWTAALTGLIAIVSGWAFDAPYFSGPASLWAFGVAPAAFALCGAYLPGGKLCIKSSCLAAGITTLVWLAWMFSGLSTLLPPLLAPAFIGIWSALAILLGTKRAALLNPQFLQAVELIRRTKKRGGKIVVLSGAGMSTSSNIPDYTSGAWLSPGVPLNDYSFANFISSDRCRNLYWQACHHFKNVVDQAVPNQGHFALTDLERSGWVDAIVTQNVDGLHQLAGAHNIVELHGTIHSLHCLSCSWQSDWQSALDVNVCPECGGLIKPAVIALGEDIQPHIWAEAWSHFKDSSLVIVVGSQLAITTTATLIADARQNNAHFIFMTLGEIGTPIFEGDIVLPLHVEFALPDLNRLLE